MITKIGVNTNTQKQKQPRFNGKIVVIAPGHIDPDLMSNKVQFVLTQLKNKDIKAKITESNYIGSIKKLFSKEETLICQFAEIIFKKKHDAEAEKLADSLRFKEVDLHFQNPNIIDKIFGY